MAKKKKSDKKANLAVKIHCKYDALIAPDKLKDHPKNRNKHPEDQITRLAKLYEYQGIRHPIIVGKKSGYIVAGHGRKQAAIKAGIKEVPVVYQVFDSDEQEYAFIQSDNAIALWAELDVSSIRADFKEFEFKFDDALLGIDKFILDPNFSAGTVLEQGILDQLKPVLVKCPHCDKEFDARKHKAKPKKTKSKN